MDYFIGDSGYYEGDRQGDDLEVPQRPSSDYQWNGVKWFVPPETAGQTIKRLERALDRHLDEVANSYRYESIRTMVTYATSEHPTFGPEGRAAVAFRDAVYAYGIDKIAACTREVDPELIPTEAELIAGLPPFTDFLE